LRLNPRMYDAHYNLGNIFFEKGQFTLAIAHYKQALELRPHWEKGRKALEAALADQAAQKENEAPATKSPASGAKGPPSSAAKLDPDRQLDPNFHGQLLRELHEIVVDTDNHSQAMLEFLQKKVEEAIREL